VKHEVLVKVGDSGGWKDGGIIACISTPGAFISPTAYKAWLELDAFPSALLALPPKIQAPHIDFKDQILAGHPRATSALPGILLWGYDTNWGRRDLQTHTTLILDLSEDDVAALAPEAKKLGAAKCAICVDYELILSGDTLAAAKDPTKHLEPARDETPIALSDCKKGCASLAPTPGVR
jgi:hypothetical protein